MFSLKNRTEKKNNALITFLFKKNILCNKPCEEMTNIEQIKTVRQCKQKSVEWLKQRESYLTSSDLGTVLGLNPYSNAEEVLFRKCGISDGFKGNVATRHGEAYEDVCVDLYCKLTNRNNTDVGLIPFSALNETFIFKCVVNGEIRNIDASFLAGSCDGITVHNNTGEINVLEIKCPYKRKDISKIPEYYLPQLMMNLHIMNIDSGDFIQYIPSGHFNNKGELSIKRIRKDNRWFYENLPKLRDFWDEVLHYREIGIENHPKYEFYLKKYNIDKV
ncbi:putative lambda-type exonuclease [Heterosigma akashiwo virus 01]|uniref:Putative lambda-type exonuclease n=1 Tax=Heterosigma akashiwo virus 01 TaxID=97195 RepID=A0A1C9C591_HAV01|nr:putative lambda-type exonuclease [Heterosigma akashiwo virus 01]AOM63453.1 putative lambda-type exonuclease [Heterosigma akashiwo virus 01]